MDLALQVHASSRRYSPAAADYPYDGRHGPALPNGSRQPLQESAGNAQPSVGLQVLTATPSYAERLTALTSIPGAMPTPPMLPTQAFSGPFDSSAGLRGLRQSHPHLPILRLERQSVNPFWLSPQFQNYRKKQADKPEQKWPDVLEDAFLDALLLIPQIGKKKFTIGGTQHGRNMLIAQYIWTAYCDSLPQGAKPDQSMWRGRKQVSSHIQVLKAFFIHIRYYHFFFPSPEKKEDKLRDKAETESFKNHPVLVALAERRLPSVRPNYDYFAQLLASDAMVTVRPKRCWIFVSNPKLELWDDRSARHTETGELLTNDNYPHLDANFDKERWTEDMRERGVLLHEYTRTLNQKEGSSVRELQLEWEENFPELHDCLDQAVHDPGCDILHLHTTLELQKRFALPQNSDLNGWVEVNISQPALLNDHWKVVTRMTRPQELCRGYSSDPTLFESTQEIDPCFTHRPGCDGRTPVCDCMNHRSRPVITVPFPAGPWARMLTKCSAYPPHPFTQAGGSKRGSKDRRGESKDDAEAESDVSQMDLIRQVAMVQELWSCPPGTAGDSSAWMRRSVLFWTFETVHGVRNVNGRNELVTLESGRTQWRFLTALDPSSPSHQQQALIPMDASSAISTSVAGTAGPLRESVLSPAPHYQQQLQATMNETFHNWAAGLNLGGASGRSSSHSHRFNNHHGLALATTTESLLPNIPAPLNIFSSLRGGLATPPPSARLHPSFTQDFESDAAQHDLGYLAAVSSAAVDPHTIISSGPSATDPFLAASTSFHAGAYDDPIVHPALPATAWDVPTLSHLDPHASAQPQASFDGSVSTNSNGSSAAGHHAWFPGAATASADGIRVTRSHHRQDWAAGGVKANVDNAEVEVWGPETASPASTIDEGDPQHHGAAWHNSKHHHSLAAVPAATTVWPDATAVTLPLASLHGPQIPVSQAGQAHMHAGYLAHQPSQARSLRVSPPKLMGSGTVPGSLKRSREEDSAEDRENYPLASVPKLRHHSSASSAGAVVGEHTW